MKFSIIMASYNQESFIHEAISSVVNQSHQDFELLIFDAMSSDGTKDVIQKFKNHPKIKIFFEKDNGLYHARNKGILMATGDILCFLNTDDYYEKDALETINKTFIENSHIDVVYGLNKVIEKNGIEIQKDVYADFDKNKRIKNYLALPDQSTFILRKHIAHIGLFDPTFSIVGDWDFWLRAMTLNLNFKAIDKYIANFRKYDETLTHSPKFTKTRFSEVKRLYRKYNDVMLSPFLIKHFWRHYVKRPLKKIVIIEKVYRVFKK